MAVTGNLRVTPEKMISISAQFAQSDSKVSSLIRSMMDIIGQLNSAWASEAAAGYFNKLRGLEDDMQKLHRMIQKHTTDLQEMAKAYRQAEKDSLQTANSLPTGGIC